MPKLTVYIDTSVFGGGFDEEFKEPTNVFFELARTGRFELLVSDVTRQEIARAPSRVQGFFDSFLPLVRLIPINQAILSLRDAYISAGILTPKSAEDAAHVASATLAQADLIVSWNFRHMVHFDKIRLYNEVNKRLGHRPIDIRSPLEVIEYEDQDL